MSSAKTHRRQLKLAAINRSTRTATRSRVVKARAAVASAPTTPETDAEVRLAIKALDMAATKRVIHPNNAARRKSRLVAALNKAKTAAK
jgi:small subunit ribosomal protein S20